MSAAIRTRSRRITKATREMYDADPQFVSLVNHGANQRPFRVVKVADFRNQTEEGTVAKSGTKTVKTEAGEAAPVNHIHRIEFSGANYATEEAVKTFLTERGYEEFAIEKDGEAFVVKGLDADQFVGEVKEIKATEGVVFKVGVPKDGAGASEETVAKTTRGADNGTTATTTETMDVPDIEDAKKRLDALRAKIVKACEDAGVKLPETKALYHVTDIAGVLNTLYWFVQDASYGMVDDSVATAAKGAAITLIGVLEKLMEAETAMYVEAFKSQASKGAGDEETTDAAGDGGSEEQPEADTTAKGDGTEADPAPVQPGVAVEEMVAKALAKVLEPVTKSLGDLTTKVAELGERDQATAQRVDALEGRSQTRKGADADEANGGTSQTEAKKTEGEKQQVRMFARSIGLQGSVD